MDSRGRREKGGTTQGFRRLLLPMRPDRRAAGADGRAGPHRVGGELLGVGADAGAASDAHGYGRRGGVYPSGAAFGAGGEGGCAGAELCGAAAAVPGAVF